ncbi:hypothetical protein BSKO_00660 [Bryopsis sp. KO-2023]|nr:hypothetical protein BSKO_00660 [Bryopsis sp. KO-2023]
MSSQNLSPEHSTQEHLSAESLRGSGSDVPLKLALALAIVKSRKTATSEGRKWKRRALAHERQSKRFRISLERLCMSSSARLFQGQRLLETLPTPVGDDADVFDLGQFSLSRTGCRSVEATKSKPEAAAAKKRTEALSHFLRNVHAVQFAKGGDVPSPCPRAAMIDMVIDFVKSTLSTMHPSALRRAYSTNVAEFLERKCSHEMKHGSDDQFDQEMDLAASIDDFVAWLISMVSNPQTSAETRGSCTEILMLLAPGPQLCNFVFAKATSAIRGTAENLSALSKEQRSGQNTPDSGEQLLHQRVQQLFENSFTLFDVQAKSLDAFSTQARSSTDRCYSSTAVLGAVVADVVVIHQQANELRTFLPLFFRMLTRCVAATISLLQDLAMEGTDKEGGSSGAKCLNSKCRQLCGVMYDHLVQGP